MITNFLFHRVNPVRDILWDPMDVKLFERLIRQITKKYKVIRMEDLISSGEYLNGSRYASIMFDDGYKDNIEYAADVLHRYQCPASFYVVTDCIEYNIPTWTFKIDYVFANTRIAEVDLMYDFLPVALRVSRLVSTEARLAYVKKFKVVLKSLRHEERMMALGEVFSRYTDVQFPKMMMNWHELRQLVQSGHYVGSHTMTHGMLGTMSSHREIHMEVLGSAKAIEANLGYFPTSIAYPLGSYNKDVIDQCRQGGYRLGIAVKQRRFNPASDSLFEIPRIELYNEPWWKVQFRMSNLLQSVRTATSYQ